MFQPQDEGFMRQALELAKQGQFTSSPNPAVGCVIVKEGRIVGRGFHAKAGEPHAEVFALREAKQQAQGATAYVTLEPCSHFGRTPPCANALIEAGVKRVVIAQQDPNPNVSGRGIKLLQQAGIETCVGVCHDQAEWLNRAFFKRMRTGLPYVKLKMAMTIDGRTATATGESKWITGEQSRSDVQTERALCCAILSTSRTVLMDNARLTVRWSQLPKAIQATYQEEKLRPPVRVIMDLQDRLHADLALFQQPSPVWVVNRDKNQGKNLPLFCQQMLLADQSKAPLWELMCQLGERDINALWVEAGATFAGALLTAGLVDELLVYIAPKLLGDKAKGLCHLPQLQHLAQAPQWHFHQAEQLDQDIKLIYLKDKLC